MAEEWKHLGGRITDEFDVVVNGIEYEVELPLLHGRIKHRQPAAQNFWHYFPPHCPGASIANFFEREKQPSVARTHYVTAAGCGCARRLRRATRWCEDSSPHSSRSD